MADDDRRVRSARMRRVVWTVRIFLALVFIYVGAVKLPAAEGMWVRLFERLAFGQWFRYVTAGVEILGGLLMLMPRATPAAVFLTISAMAGALLVHATVTGFGPQTVVVCILLALSLFVGSSYSRAHRRTIRTGTVGGLSVISVLALFIAMPTAPPVPDELEGTWAGRTFNGARVVLDLRVDAAGVQGTLTRNNRSAPISDAAMAGNGLAFSAPLGRRTERFTGTFWSRDAIWLTIDSMGVLAPMTGAVFRRQMVESRGARPRSRRSVVSEVGPADPPREIYSARAVDSVEVGATATRIWNGRLVTMPVITDMKR